MDKQAENLIKQLSEYIDNQHKELLEESDAHAVALKQLGDAFSKIDKLEVLNAELLGR